MTSNEHPNATILAELGRRSFQHAAAFAERSGSQQATAGSGTMFTTCDRYFVVTAGHVISDIVWKSSQLVDYQCVLAARDSGSGFVELRGNPAYLVEDPYDIGVVELTESQATSIGAAHFATNDDVAPLGFEARTSLIGGFPSATDSGDQGRLNSQLIRIVADLLPGPPDEDGLRYPPQPRWDMWCLHETNSRDLHGNASRLPRLEGISGSAIWGLSTPPGRLPANPQNQMKLIGVQKSYYSNKFIRGTSWLALAGLLRGVDDELRARIRVLDEQGDPHPGHTILPTVRFQMP